MNLIFVWQRSESFAGHSGSGGDGRRKSFEVVSSFLVLKLSCAITFLLSHAHTHSLTWLHTDTLQLPNSLSKIFMPVVTFPPMGTTGVFVENHQRGRQTFHTNCCILKQHEILRFFSPSTPAEDAALLYCMPVLLLEPGCYTKARSSCFLQ